LRYLKAEIVRLLLDHFGSDSRRIEHALEVFIEAECRRRAMPDPEIYDAEIVTAVALLHDVGIKPSEEKYGYNNGRTQEELGPPIAERLLTGIAFPQEKIPVVCEIIGNHHSPSRYDYPELELLKIADRIVNRRDEG
jgi:HD superfamily phosphodiesterase